jgi:hypothetical protein
MAVLQLYGYTPQTAVMQSTVPTFTERKVNKSEMELKQSIGKEKEYVKLSLYQVI